MVCLDVFNPRAPEKHNKNQTNKKPKDFILVFLLEHQDILCSNNNKNPLKKVCLGNKQTLCFNSGTNVKCFPINAIAIKLQQIGMANVADEGKYWTNQEDKSRGSPFRKS